MKNGQPTRRDFLKTSVAAMTAGTMPYWFTSESSQAFAYRSANERPVVGCIGTGSRWNAIGPQAARFGDIVAVCDVDRIHAERAREKVRNIQRENGRAPQVDMYGDYRKILDRDDIDVVTIVTPDHWHTKPLIEAMRAGKDVYCEKPLTLTIEEGKQIIKVLDETRRVVQVGTQQRTEMGQRFLKAIAIIRDGRIGKLRRVTAVIGGAPTGGPFKVEPVPPHLNWDMWLGQAPYTGYMPKRCHYEFRWWYEYSGGKMTDWGAHHVDIAQWAMGMDKSGPISVEGTAKHPCEFRNGYPVRDDVYNTATQFTVVCKFPNGVELRIMHNDPEHGISNGILFEGEYDGPPGRFWVNRGKIVGRPVEDLKTRPLPEGAIEEVYRGKKPTSHMQNFFDCVKSREMPISDVYTHHRALTTCHLANIAIRLGRKLRWDPEAQQIVGDPEANQWQAREQRKGYEIEV